ncbi:hypothetical protein BDZ45DRAFT_729363 [Acephala macrosclerotiorum]|nr:hypothetical protein BDZ45DRAFT_729363 [Acephala macrosclerotiorum]
MQLHRRTPLVGRSPRRRLRRFLPIRHVELPWFGGNGSSVDNCVTTGPFASRIEHTGRLEETTDYCFARKFNQTKGLSYGARSNVEDCYEFGGEDFEDFYGCMAYYPHIAGHQATGGVMTDVDSSPGDSVFYQHHNYLDRLYWQ